MSARIILISGPPASGKSSIAKQVARHLGMPLLMKDDIKETLFDTMGWSDLEWSKKLGGATYEVLFLLIERIVEAGSSLVVESTVHPEHHTDRIKDLMTRFGLELREVHVFADPDVLRQRFKDRDRHPGHVDDVSDIDFEAAVDRHTYGPLFLDPAPVKVDTTDEESVDLDQIVQEIDADQEGRGGASNR